MHIELTTTTLSFELKTYTEEFPVSQALLDFYFITGGIF